MVVETVQPFLLTKVRGPHHKSFEWHMDTPVSNQLTYYLHFLTSYYSSMTKLTLALRALKKFLKYIKDIPELLFKSKDSLTATLYSANQIVCLIIYLGLGDGINLTFPTFTLIC